MMLKWPWLAHIMPHCEQKRPSMVASKHHVAVHREARHMPFTTLEVRGQQSEQTWKFLLLPPSHSTWPLLTFTHCTSTARSRQYISRNIRNTLLLNNSLLFIAETKASLIFRAYLEFQVAACWDRDVQAPHIPI